MLHWSFHSVHCHTVWLAGVPVVVARKMQQGTTLLGQMVSSAQAAVAAAADGANFVLLQVGFKVF